MKNLDLDIMEKRTYKEKTKLDKKDKIMISFYIVMAIFEIVIAIVEKDTTWFVCSTLWITIAVIEYCNAKIMKGRDFLIEIQGKNIEIQNNIIKKLLTDTTFEVELNKIKIPAHFTKPKPKKLESKLEYYKRNNKFQSQIIIDEKYNLLDGYTSYLIAKNLNRLTVHVRMKKASDII